MSFAQTWEEGDMNGGDLMPVVVVPDTHGHVAHVERLLKVLRGKGLLADHRLVFLGDYIDRGPEVRALVELAIALEREGHVFLAGNHEFVIEQVLTSDTGDAAYWIKEWATAYENKTLESYGVHPPTKHTDRSWRAASEEFKAALPHTHRGFLVSRPFVHETDSFIFVHAGITEDPWEVQRQALCARVSLDPRGPPPQLFSHTLARRTEHPAHKCVVSAHATRVLPLVTDKRILLHCGVDSGGSLVAWVSDTGEVITITV